MRACPTNVMHWDNSTYACAGRSYNFLADGAVSKLFLQRVHTQCRSKPQGWLCCLRIGGWHCWKGTCDWFIACGVPQVSRHMRLHDPAPHCLIQTVQLPLQQMLLCVTQLVRASPSLRNISFFTCISCEKITSDQLYNRLMTEDS